MSIIQRTIKSSETPGLTLDVITIDFNCSGITNRSINVREFYDGNKLSLESALNTADLINKACELLVEYRKIANYFNSRYFTSEQAAKAFIDRYKISNSIPNWIDFEIFNETRILSRLLRVSENAIILNEEFDTWTIKDYIEYSQYFADPKDDERELCQIEVKEPRHFISAEEITFNGKDYEYGN